MARVMASAPGLRDAQLHEAISGEAWFQLINVAYRNGVTLRRLRMQASARLVGGDPATFEWEVRHLPFDHTRIAASPPYRQQAGQDLPDPSGQRVDQPVRGKSGLGGGLSAGQAQGPDERRSVGIRTRSTRGGVHQRPDRVVHRQMRPHFLFHAIGRA
ncbi:hypothetical protein [Umezawaea sp. Da 62-37]|uniref:hypothetical protein n=1 Tax=Umezawaea sp. Da 62-37 TaxID=3075927 RepID=UPI0028F6F1C4|nr:hypothetical protein [Umezawaea sp. Da 62-37]WNV87691.1 hypothetical protein RM788_05195 [Umezawaea sp. Da 62-37]